MNKSIHNDKLLLNRWNLWLTAWRGQSQLRGLWAAQRRTPADTARRSHTFSVQENNNTKQLMEILWWKFIMRYEIMTFSDRSCLWVHLMVISAESTQHHGAQKGTGCTFKKPELIQRGVFLRHDIWENSQNLHKEVFHRTWYMVRKDKEEVRSSSGSICRGRPSAVPLGRKTSPNKGIHPAYPGYRSETPSQKIFFPLQYSVDIDI